MEAIMKEGRKEEDNYYKLLGCDVGSSAEQIQTEYKVLALQYHPDKNPDDPEAEEKFQRLQRAKEVLCDPEQRARYDKWLNSGLAISYDQWSSVPAMTTTLHWASPNTKERMLPPTSSSSATSSPSKSSRRASEQVSGILSGRTNESVRVARPSEVWERDTSEVLKKFRNYEI